MNKKFIVKKIIETLLKEYENPVCTLEYNKPYELLFATILAAQSKDSMVNKITKDLFSKYNTLEKFAKANINELESEIKAIGFYRNKAKNIIETANILINKYSGNLPDNIEELIKLKGVGRKTANVILANIFDIPSIIVDTHCMRLSKRLGITKHSDPEKIEKELRDIIPKKYYTIFSNLMVYHGRKICMAKKPRCNICSINQYCEYYKNFKHG
ncbi:endonuclease III [Caldicellulosiruptoraceae bacterium PP1]